MELTIQWRGGSVGVGSETKKQIIAGQLVVRPRRKNRAQEQHNVWGGQEVVLFYTVQPL